MDSSKKYNYAFIDSQNLNLGIKSLGWDLDFKKFRLYLKNKYHVEKAYLFIGHVSGNERLYLNLQQYGYIVVFKPTLEFREKNKIKIKGNVDSELVLHAVIEKDNYNRAIIVSGDGDFYCLAEYLISIGKLERILVPNSRYSSLLRKFGEYISEIERLKCLLEKRTEIGVRSKP